MNFKIKDKHVGLGCKSFIIAEIGSNHNQDFELALNLIDKAAEAGVDAVKFQTFRADAHVSKFAEMPSYLKGYENIHELIKSLELNRDWQKPLKEYAEEKGLIFFSSPCDYEAVDQLEKIGVPAHKVASFDLPDLDLIRYIAKTQKPILLSTGLADWMEIQRAVDVCREEGNNQILLFQCTSLYPAPANLSNLKAMQTMRDNFQVVVGYSDHTLGDNIPVAAVAMGASAIEKHFTLDRKMSGPDHAFAIEPDELRIMVRKIREVESAIGDGSKSGPRNEEMDMFHKVRRSLHASKDIKKGTVITEDMLVSKRPGFGVPIYLKDIVIGRVAREDINKDSWISWDLI
ncbi:N-acetylneuraminate synthase [Nitrincola lacisaponensis]|uniref:N-acetylneuraminate synthase n=1 Tax=Nitrincola lacisaponensis TaxID=267850 RepID=A0A063Y7Q3_9GAMM|nr:N-acetylneuraminate synthase family protein [Nitrincola lacisaponensis]KDE41155.1 N-acetylneuraminate synthase [Nitrincola lacisaponensis]